MRPCHFDPKMSSSALNPREPADVLPIRVQSLGSHCWWYWCWSAVGKAEVNKDKLYLLVPRLAPEELSRLT